MADISSEGGKLLSNGLPVATESQVLGVGQTWQDVTALRVVDTDYTNDTGKPIQISATCIGTGTSVQATTDIYVDGVRIARNRSQADGTNSYAGAMAIIPNGSVYKVIAFTSTLHLWAELR